VRNDPTSLIEDSKKSQMHQLGTLEELVLLSVCSLTTDAYGVTVHKQLTDQSGRALTLGAIHTTLYRLQDKGFLESSMGGATSERGGRRKRLFSATGTGLEALRSARTLREKFWKVIPALDQTISAIPAF
jgi:PadR family transcriptional regulator PadR